MKEITILVLDEITFLNIENHLEESDIEYTQRLLSNSSFGSLNEYQSFAEITIKTGDEEKILKVIEKEQYNNRLQISIAETKGRKWSNYIKAGLIIYSILVTLICFKYWHLSYIASSDRNFDIKWNSDNTILNYIDKKTKKPVASYVDENYDLNYELQYGYYQGKGPISISYDEDENGYYEKVEHYSVDGRTAGWYLDADQDGLFEYSVTILENGDTLTAVDPDQNGIMEIEEKPL